MNNLDVARKGIRAFEANDHATVSSLITEDFTLSGAVPQTLGKQDFLGFMHAMITAFPDFKFNETFTEEGADKVVITQHITGTHTGTLALPGMPPIPATGKKVALPEEKQVFTFRDGKFAKSEGHPVPGGGVMGILAQLGVQMPG